jgi:hypothetical protein
MKFPLVTNQWVFVGTTAITIILPPLSPPYRTVPRPLMHRQPQSTWCHNPKDQNLSSSIFHAINVLPLIFLNTDVM